MFFLQVCNLYLLTVSTYSLLLMLPFQSGVMIFGAHPTIRINKLVTDFWMPFLCNGIICGKNSENLFVDSSPVYRIISCLNQMLILWLLQCILLLKSLLMWRLLWYEVISIHLFPFCALFRRLNGSDTVNNKYKSVGFLKLHIYETYFVFVSDFRCSHLRCAQCKVHACSCLKSAWIIVYGILKSL